MPIDPSIALQARPIELQNPLAQYAQAQQIGGMQNQSRLADLMYTEKQREIEQTQALNDIYKNSLSDSGDIDRTKLYGGIAAGGLGSKLPGLQKSFLEADKEKADIELKGSQSKKAVAETAGLTADQREKKRQTAISDIAAFTSPQQALESLAAHEKSGDLTPENAAAVRATIPQNPADFPKWQVSMLQRIMSAKDSAAQVAPDAGQRLTSETSIKTNAATNETSRANNADTQAGEDRRAKAARAAAKIPANYQANPDGSVSPIVGGPADPNNSRPSVEYLKQAEAYQNMDDAITGYKKVLSTFGSMDALRPEKRAEMGTAYQNTLLQAKEIYKLGVLNGPDEGILKSIINNPLDLKTAIVPKEALIKQANDLQAIVKRGNENLAKVNKQKTLSLNSEGAGNGAGAGGAPAVGTVDSGYTFKGGDPANSANWVKK